MIASMILFSIAGVFYHYRLQAADRFARGQCGAYAAAVNTLPRKEERAVPRPKATPITCMDVVEEAEDAEPSV